MSSKHPRPGHHPRPSDVMARLTLSTLERGSDRPGFWGEPQVYRALLVSGLSVLMSGVSLLLEDLAGDLPPSP